MIGIVYSFDGCLNGDDGIKGESDWRIKLLEDEKMLKEGKSTIQSLLLEIVIGWKYVDSCENRKTFVMWHLVWMNKKEMIISFKIHQTQKWYSSISHCELDWIELKKKFIAFQMKNEKKTHIMNEMQLSYNGKYVLLFHS